MKRILVCFGTRPEVIKLAPVIKELKKLTGVKITTCSTAQHKEMLLQMLKIFEIRADFDLDIMRDNQSLTDISGRIFERMPKIFSKVKPDLLVIQGDTTSACIAAQVAFQMKIAVAHIEAGLRTHNKFSPYPEEINRRIIAGVADLNFAPTAVAKNNLLSEGIAKESIFVTGNTVVDAVERLQPELKKKEPNFIKFLTPNFILITAHRRENLGKPLINICLAVKQLADSHPETQFVFPVHLNPQVQKVVKPTLSDRDNILLLPPTSYIEMLYLLSKCKLVLTDSGGLQEEAPSFRKPVLVMRSVTERPEGVDLGISTLVGTDKKIIVDKVNCLLDNESVYKKMVSEVNPYGDGKAAKRISKIIKAYLN